MLPKPVKPVWGLGFGAWGNRLSVLHALEEIHLLIKGLFAFRGLGFKGNLQRVRTANQAMFKKFSALGFRVEGSSALCKVRERILAGSHWLCRGL